jgi:hypothetical protein
MPTELEREQTLLQQLHATHDPVAQREADQLQKLYHDRQMDRLAQDVYHAANGEDIGHPPKGWTRVLESPELWEKYSKELGISELELKQALHPDGSGFRAELYEPDDDMKNAGYKATIAIKGSSGMVKTSDGGHHSTTTEDFGANNFPQSIGLETDFYDRGMRLGHLFKERGIPFESTGHSLGGGVSTAIAAVTETPATTFNAAGLNPITTARFAQQNPGVMVPKDLNPLITNYQVQGELLNDGVQNNIHNMDALRRRELGGVLQEVSDVLQRVPEARGLFEQKLATGLPPQAQQTIHAFVDKVATGDTNRMLQDLPLAAGQQRILAAMTRDEQGNLVKREKVLSLPEVTQLAGPLLESLAVVSTTARMGERTGEAVAASGHLSAQGLHVAGRGVDSAADTLGASAQAVTQAQGTVVQTGEHLMGAALAHARTAGAEVQAQIDQRLGQAEHLNEEAKAAVLRSVSQLLPEQMQRSLQEQAAHHDQAGLEAERRGTEAANADRHAGEVDASAIRSTTHTAEAATIKVTEAYGAAQHAVIGGIGHNERANLDATAQGIEDVSRHAPATFTAFGAAGGLGLSAILELNSANYPRLAETALAISQGKHAADEALDRHLMASTVTPSLDAHIQSHERQAEQILHQSQPQLRPFSDPAHPQNVLYNALKERFPSGTSPELLSQATATCYMSGIKQPDDLGSIIGANGKILFNSNSIFAQPAQLDIHQPAPSVQQTMQQVQQFDQHQAQNHAQHQAQQAQINAQQPQGPAPGGY